MRAPSCAWAWMAEAGDDGRLTVDQQTSFRRHAEHCAICAAGVGEVNRLRERMEAIPAPAVSDFDHHRQRQLLLARAGGVQVMSSMSRPVWPRALAISALTIAVVGVGVGAWRSGSRGGNTVAFAPRYEVTALSDASWTNEEGGPVARVRLSRGSAEFHVHKLNAGQRFFATLPDGEIEVRGTRFVVNIVDGRTKYVVVMEGKVALRQGEGGERLLLAGDRWDAPASAPVVIASRERPAVALVPPPSMTAVENNPVRRATGHPPLRAETPPRTGRAIAGAEALSPRESPSAQVVTPDAAPNLFARGMSAFRAGQYSEAEGVWRQFAGEHPQDPRIEDIAFLRAVVRARLGDPDGAASLARAYLERFPRGMRRKEAEALIRHAGQ